MAEKTYRVVASGNTYNNRDELKSWAFQWQGGTEMVWTRDRVSEFERRQWEDNVEHGYWSGIVLVFEEEPNG